LRLGATQASSHFDDRYPEMEDERDRDLRPHPKAVVLKASTHHFDG
jgi:hypothetical protein